MVRFGLSGTVVAGLVSVGVALAAPAPESDLDVQVIVTKAIQARGGAVNVDKYQAYTCKFTGAFHDGPMEETISGTTQEQAPDKSITKITIKVGGVETPITQVLAGDKAWESINGVTSELDKEAMAEAREEMHASSLADLHGIRGKGVKLSSLGESKVDGKSVVGVRVSCAGYRDVNIFFEREKSLLLKMETRAKENGVEFKQESMYGEYKNISGLMIPFKVAVKRDGKSYLTMEITEVTVAEKLPDSTFAKP